MLKIVNSYISKRNTLINRVNSTSRAHNKDKSVYFHWYLSPLPFIHVIYASISYSIQSTLSSQFIHSRVALRIQQIFMHGVKIWKQRDSRVSQSLVFCNLLPLKYRSISPVPSRYFLAMLSFRFPRILKQSRYFSASNRIDISPRFGEILDFTNIIRWIRDICK